MRGNGRSERNYIMRGIAYSIRLDTANVAVLIIYPPIMIGACMSFADELRLHDDRLVITAPRV